MSHKAISKNLDRKDERDFKDLFVNREFRVVADEPDYLVVDKPAPLPVHPVSRFREINLLRLLEKDLGMPLHVVNRLDSETSGVILFAKHPGAANLLGELFKKREVQKTYEAIVCGRLASSEGRIDLRLGGEKTRYCFQSLPDVRGKRAVTRYKVLKKGKSFSHLRLFPETGRTHQLRTHLAAWGHPLVGDKIYIDRRIFENYVHTGWQETMKEKVFLSRLALHAACLEFKDPFTGDEKKYHSPMPSLLTDFIHLEIR